jgi:2-hydroxychromene-2-carboxylate isomerase
MGESPQPAFYYDLFSADAYLAAERVMQVLPVAAEWVPVQAAGLPAADTLQGFRCEADRLAYFDRVERTAARREMQPLRWPEPFPFDSALAMRVATYAKQIGRAVAFSLAAFRQAFAGARDLSVPDNVLIAASACEMHPAAVLKGAELRSVAAALDEATAVAAERGVHDVPAVWVPDPAAPNGGLVFHGDDDLERAADALGAAA